MKKLLYLTIITSFVICSFHCKTPSLPVGELQETGEMYLTAENKITFASVAQGKEQIVRDDVENYFDQVRRLDMQIQMNSISRGDDATLLKDYKLHLQNSVMEWTPKEKTFVSNIFKKATKYVEAISKDILVDNITLIKCNMNHYGQGVFYTREKAIVIPVNVLQREDAEDFLKTTLHEIFHIYARYNTDKRAKLYERIGYFPIDMPQVPDILERRVLLNPDGVNFNYGIEVVEKKSGEKITAMPIIYSKMLNFDPKVTDFFEYLQFHLFKVEDGEVVTTRNGETTVKIKYIKGFYDQIGTNTQYIIHPDEVLADNFTLMCLSNDNESILREEYNIGKKGKQLIQDLKSIIRE